MVLLFDRIKTFCLAHGFDKTYWIGYSGGLDSHVLLHLCAELRKHYPLRLKAVHVHHGLSAHAFDWVRHCKKICADLQIELIEKSVNAKAGVGDSPEEIARDLRYRVFAELIEPQDILLTAHQQDDQAETVLIQLLRGAGPKGLAAMPVLKAFAAGFHARPLLAVSRVELKKYAEEQCLTWINDESNENKNFTRNFLRHAIFPLLKQRWPTVTKTLARVADHCAEADALVATIAISDLAACRGEKNQTLMIEKLILLDAARQRQVLRAWLSEQGFALPSAVQLQQIQHDFLQSSADKSPYMCWDTVELRRYRGELYCMHPLAEHDATQIFSWNLTQTLNLPPIGTLHAMRIEQIGLALDVKQVTVRFRQGGERCYFVERRCHRLLKHLMQEWAIPPWERDRLPLLFIEDTLIAVVGFFLDARYKSVPDSLFPCSLS